MGTEGAVAYCRYGGSREALPLVRLSVGFNQPGDDTWVETWDVRGGGHGVGRLVVAAGHAERDWRVGLLR